MVIAIVASVLVAFHLEPARIASLPLDRRFTAPQIALLEKLNRADRDHLPSLRQLVVPDQ